MESAETEKLEQSESLLVTRKGGEGVETEWRARKQRNRNSLILCS